MKSFFSQKNINKSNDSPFADITKARLNHHLIIHACTIMIYFLFFNSFHLEQMIPRISTVIHILIIHTKPYMYTVFTKLTEKIFCRVYYFKGIFSLRSAHPNHFICKSVDVFMSSTCFTYNNCNLTVIDIQEQKTRLE